MKLVLTVRALTVPCTAVVLHVTPSLVPRDESNVRQHLTVSRYYRGVDNFGDAEAATVTLPAAADPHAAGDAFDEQFLCLRIVGRSADAAPDVAVKNGYPSCRFRVL